MDYGNTQITKHALKEPESSNVEVVHNMDQEEDSVSLKKTKKHSHFAFGVFCVLASFVNTGNQPCFRSGHVQFIRTMQCQQNTALTWTVGHHARWWWEPCPSCWLHNWLSPLGLSAVYPVGTNLATGGNMTVSYIGDHELHEMVHHNCITGYLP